MNHEFRSNQAPFSWRMCFSRRGCVVYFCKFVEHFFKCKSKKSLAGNEEIKTIFL
jgi:hypothetical protein